MVSKRKLSIKCNKDDLQKLGIETHSKAIRPAEKVQLKTAIVSDE